MLSKVVFSLLIVVSAIGSTLASPDGNGRDLGSSTYRKYQVKTFPAYVTHGVNVYNGKKIFDFSSSSNVLSSLPPMEDIGVYNPDPAATNATQIDEDTPQDSLMASMFPYAYHTLMQVPVGKPDPIGPFNVPIYSTPTFTPTSSSILDRSEPSPFQESDKLENQGNYIAYRKPGPGLTLKEYNTAWGWMKVLCKKDGTGSYKIKIKGIPLGLYTAWDIIVKDPLKPEETLVLSPYGGAPNVIATDKSGFGKMERKLNYCPLSKCDGADRCTVGIIMLYHSDSMVYGSGPDLSAQGYGIGNAGTNHMMFLTNGKALVGSPKWIG